MAEIQYLDTELMEKMCHPIAVDIFDTKEDPISKFDDRQHSLLDSALNLPKATFGGKDLYPTLINKATILFYALNKNHPFKNGNKRIALVSLLVFLYINDYWLDAGKEEMFKKTLYVAESKSEDRGRVFKHIQFWISSHLVSLTENNA
ncbi:MAG TPA: type II toxin-antitoxin system death-on-curing family toxin [Candidatus Paceibacterota bacterium]